MTAKPPPAEDALTMLERQCSELAGRLELAIPFLRHPENLRAAVNDLRDPLNRIEPMTR